MALDRETQRGTDSLRKGPPHQGKRVERSVLINFIITVAVSSVKHWENVYFISLKARSIPWVAKLNKLPDAGHPCLMPSLLAAPLYSLFANFFLMQKRG